MRLEQNNRPGTGPSPETQPTPVASRNARSEAPEPRYVSLPGTPLRVLASGPSPDFDWIT